MRLGFDIDGVFASIMEAWCKGFAQVAGEDKFLPGDYPEPHDYNIHTARGYTQEHARLFWDMVHADPDWWFNLPTWVENVAILREHIHDISHDHEVYFVTQRSGIQVKRQTEDWLLEHLDYSATVLIVGHGEKGNIAKSLNLDVFVEDYHENAIDIVRKSPSTRVYLINRRYNQMERLKTPAQGILSGVSWDRAVELVRSRRVTDVGEVLRAESLIPYTGVALK